MDKTTQQQVSHGIQWLMKPQTEPSLSFKDFAVVPDSSSLAQYRALTARFSLMRQFKDGQVQDALIRFDKSSRRRRGVEATPIVLPPYEHQEIFIAAIKGRKNDAIAKVVKAIEGTPDVKSLLSAPDIKEAWLQAATAGQRIVGGFSLTDQFMILFGRESLEAAKALFNFPENPGRYKARPEREPAFMSRGGIGISVVQYPAQIEKAKQQLLSFMEVETYRTKNLYCFINFSLVESHGDKLEDLRKSGIKIIPAVTEKNMMLARENIRPQHDQEAEDQIVRRLNCMSNVLMDNADVKSLPLQPYLKGLA